MILNIKSIQDHIYCQNNQIQGNLGLSLVKKSLENTGFGSFWIIERDIPSIENTDLRSTRVSLENWLSSLKDTQLQESLTWVFWQVIKVGKYMENLFMPLNWGDEFHIFIENNPNIDCTTTLRLFHPLIEEKELEEFLDVD